MKTTATYHESYQPKQGFGARLLFYAFLLSLIGLSKAFAQVPSAPVADTATNITCTGFTANWSAVTGATTYYLDVATDSTFTSYVTSFNNLNVGNVTTYSLSGLNSGNHFYRVRAEDGNGTSLNSNIVSVSVFSTPIAQFTYATVCFGDTITFADASFVQNSTISNYLWVFGDGSPNSNDQSPNHLYLAYGTYSVTLIVSTIDGCSNAITNSVSVLDCMQDSTQSFVYPSATYCQSGTNPTPTINISGGTFSATPAGLVFVDINTGEIDIALSAVGVYTLAYTYGGSTDAITFTITNATPDATFSYAAYLFDPSAPNPLPIFGSGASAGSFLGDVGVVINANTGEIDLSASTAGYHHIYNTIPQSGSCAVATAYDTIFIAPEAGCSSFLLENGPVSQTYYCLPDSIDLFSFGYHYFGLSAGTTTALVSWGDGTTETYTITQPAGDGLIFLDANSHSYSSPGFYTVLCTFINPSACHNDSIVTVMDVGNACSNLVGNLFVDANNNCAMDNGELGIANTLVTATQGGSVYYAWTDYLGYYTFYQLTSGTYTVEVAGLTSGYSITCSNSQPQSVTISSGVATVNFAASCNGAFDAAITGISIWSALYPGQPEMILPHVGVLNAACNSTVVAGQVKLVLDACTQFTGAPTYSGAGAPDAVITASTGDTLVWNVADINNIGNFSYFDYAIDIMMCTTAQVGDSACITMMILPTNGDADPSNNTYTRCFEIGVSYDPNNKEVQPLGVGAQGFIPAAQPSLTYTLNFQNTGTALAFNIYIMDTIDANIDINSIEILSASHRVQAYTLEDRAVKFMFANIMLPDSTSNELESHGYVTFKVKLNTGLTPGTEIENTGHIYFDYNDPIVTNTTLNTIEFPSSVNAIGKSTVVKVFPNPAKESVTVVSNSNNTGTITITDLLGKTVKEVTTTNDKTVVNTADLQSGVYFIKLTQNNASTTEKIMIAK